MQHNFLYEQISKDISSAINDGEYHFNSRLPSLREVSEMYSVSMATAIQAYQTLEDKGLIESRPKSGYYVTSMLNKQIAQPAISQPTVTPTTVTVAQLAMTIVNDARQPRVVNLGAAVPGTDVLPLGQLARSMAGVSRREWKAAGNYEDARGNEVLRKEITRLMRDTGCRCKADEIIITNGCLEALNLALRTVAKPGDTIAIESPTYFGILQTIENLGMRALEIPTHPAHGIEPDALKHALKKQKISACILIPSFSNPLGSCMPEKNKQDIVALLEKAKIPLIEDDVYGFLSYEQPRPKSAKSYDKTGNVIYCSSFSKTVAPGIRIGWMIPGRFTEQVAYQKFLDNISTAVHPQLALAEIIHRGQFKKAVRQSARLYQHRMEQLRYWITEYFPEGTRLTVPQGGFVIWLELPKQIDALELYRKAMEKRISISPGQLFSSQTQYKHHIRLSCGAVDGELAHKSVKTLGKLAKNLCY